MNTPEERPSKEDREKRAETPIIDGDARPDIDLHPEDKLKDHPIPTPKDNEKFTKNRVDVNSLEDYKDSKEA
jgi:hypothetical protein